MTAVFARYVGLVYYAVQLIVRSMRFTKDRRSPAWAWISNRLDDIGPGPFGVGVACNWEGSRPIWFYDQCRVASGLLVERMLKDWPVEMSLADRCSSLSGDRPQVSVIIPHRGLDRIAHLQAVLRSLASQRGVSFEVLVVEQDSQHRLDGMLPSWVYHVFDASPADEDRFNRAKALNLGAAHSRGEVLILHDGDMVVPVDYLSEIRGLCQKGYDVVNTKRFIAYMDQRSSASVFRGNGLSGAMAEQIVSNLRGGGSVGITRSGFQSIGGLDSGFVGWGGEDEEFWDRCRLLEVFDAGYMPLFHLWHRGQPGKNAVGGKGLHTADYFSSCMKHSREERVARLRLQNGSSA